LRLLRLLIVFVVTIVVIAAAGCRKQLGAKEALDGLIHGVFGHHLHCFLARGEFVKLEDLVPVRVLLALHVLQAPQRRLAELAEV
jgi:hypothetical protein